MRKTLIAGQPEEPANDGLDAVERSLTVRGHPVHCFVEADT